MILAGLIHFTKKLRKKDLILPFRTEIAELYEKTPLQVFYQFFD